MSKSDVVVIGGGLNGLVAATAMAKAGRSVTLLEAAEELGGQAIGDAFHPGHRGAGPLWETAQLRAEVVDALDLKRHGLRFLAQSPGVLVPDEKSGVMLYDEVERSLEELGDEAEAYAKWRAFLARIAPVMRNALNDLPAGVDRITFKDALGLFKKGLSLRRLGKADMLEIMRVNLLCSADFTDEWFRSDRLKAALAVPAHVGSNTGPWSPGTAINLILAMCGVERHVEGGAPALIEAATTAAKAAGVLLRTGSRVVRLQLKKNKVTGLELAGGEQLESQLVLASCHPKHLFLELIPPEKLRYDLQKRMEDYRSHGTTALVHLALAEPLRFTCRGASEISEARIVTGIDDLERSFDPIKYRRCSEKPLLEVFRPGSAPAGKDTVTLRVHFVPFNLEGGWNDAARAQLAQSAIATLAEVAPNLNVIAQQVLAPPDLEGRYGTTGGHIYHGEHSLDQLLIRPMPGRTSHTTPVEGLFLCGAGSAPGGGLSGLPGLLGARAALNS